MFKFQMFILLVVLLSGCASSPRVYKSDFQGKAPSYWEHGSPYFEAKSNGFDYQFTSKEVKDDEIYFEIKITNTGKVADTIDHQFFSLIDSTSKRVVMSQDPEQILKALRVELDFVNQRMEDNQLSSGVAVTDSIVLISDSVLSMSNPTSQQRKDIEARAKERKEREDEIRETDLDLKGEKVALLESISKAESNLLRKHTLNPGEVVKKKVLFRQTPVTGNYLIVIKGVEGGDLPLLNISEEI
jgi:hypothetical protein